MSDDRTVSGRRADEDAAEASLRPQTLADFTGQKASRENLAIFIQAAKSRGEALDHVLLHGPPGLGKTTLSQIVARELGVGFRATSGPVIQRAGAPCVLISLQPNKAMDYANGTTFLQLEHDNATALPEICCALRRASGEPGAATLPPPRLRPSVATPSRARRPAASRARPASNAGGPAAND